MNNTKIKESTAYNGQNGIWLSEANVGLLNKSLRNTRGRGVRVVDFESTL